MEKHHTCDGVANGDGNHVVHNVLAHRDWRAQLHAKRNLRSGITQLGGSIEPGSSLLQAAGGWAVTTWAAM